MSGLVRADWSRFARSERPAPHAGMNTHDSAATSMNKISAPMRTALSEFQGMRVPFKTMRTPVHFATTQDMTLRRIGCALDHIPRRRPTFPAPLASASPPQRPAGMDAWMKDPGLTARFSSAALVAEVSY